MLMRPGELDSLDQAYARDEGLLDGSLPPYFGDEDPDANATVAAQNKAIADWLSWNAKVVIIKRELKQRRKAAFEAEGLI